MCRLFHYFGEFSSLFVFKTYIEMYDYIRFLLFLGNSFIVLKKWSSLNGPSFWLDLIIILIEFRIINCEIWMIFLHVFKTYIEIIRLYPRLKMIEFEWSKFLIRLNYHFNRISLIVKYEYEWFFFAFLKLISKLYDYILI